jgi:tRNA pseudouridine38-40 synthase
VSPLDAPTTARIQGPFDLALASTATRLLLGEHDFSAFAKTGGAHTSAVRRIFAAEWLEWPDDRLCFRIVGSGFLRGMVRAIVGSLLEVGYGRRSIDGFSSLLYRGQAAGRQDAGPNAPAHGLILHEVSYPDWPALEAWPEAPA